MEESALIKLVKEQLKYNKQLLALYLSMDKLERKEQSSEQFFLATSHRYLIKEKIESLTVLISLAEEFIVEHEGELPLNFID